MFHNTDDHRADRSTNPSPGRQTTVSQNNNEIKDASQISHKEVNNQAFS